ncbi:TetR/AcrR family transcriptional regulator [Kribbella sp. NBC_01505]|uniref:TetR/AcrR family transcriptional regulator n=1 Tax=Kribbella sp. NBC_01505 TaxID=2903580 RepID=UPI003865F2F9
MTEQQRSVTNVARRAQIVRAAIEVLAESGYAGASFARITKHAGLSSPRMVSYHFRDKDDLVQQVLIEVFTAGAQAILERMAQETTLRGKLVGYLEANLRFVHDHPQDVAALTAIGPYVRKPDGEHYDQQSSREVSVHGLEGLLAEGQRSGDFQDFDIRSMAVAIRGAVDAAPAQFHGTPALDLDTYTRELVALFTARIVASGIEEDQ